MQILYSRCCGIDVHKDSVTACVLVYKDKPAPEVRKKEFATHKKALGDRRQLELPSSVAPGKVVDVEQLGNLRLWLHVNQVIHVAMESTGVYWKPVWQALEGHFELILPIPIRSRLCRAAKRMRAIASELQSCWRMG